MKKSLLTAAFVLGAFVANSQTAGNLYIGGTLGFNSQTTTTSAGSVSIENPKTTNYIVLPEIGYFLRDDISVGIAIGVGGNKTIERFDDIPFNNILEREDKRTYFATVIYARKFFPVNEFFSFYAGLNFGMNPGKTTTTTQFNNGDATTIVESKNTLMGAGLNAGINYRITPRVTLMGSFAVLGFTSNKNVNEAPVPNIETKTNNFGFNVSTYGTPFSIGMYYNINN